MSGEFPPFSTTTVHDVRVINRSRWVIIYSSTCWLCTFHWCESTCWLSTSHESVLQHANSTYCPLLMLTPTVSTLYTRVTSQPLLPGWRHRGDTRWQGRDLYPGQSDWLTSPISRSECLIDTWRYLWLATWRPMAELPGWRPTVTAIDWLDLYAGWLTRDVVRVIDWLDLYPGWLTRY